MQILTINIKNDTLADKVMWLLSHFKNDGLDIVSKEDIEDLKLLKFTRNERRQSFEDYLKNAIKDLNYTTPPKKIKQLFVKFNFKNS